LEEIWSSLPQAGAQRSGATRKMAIPRSIHHVPFDKLKDLFETTEQAQLLILKALSV
jgi:hypothetical protein